MLLTQVPSDGVWQGYDGEWKHVSQQLVALAEATAADKFAWRPAPGIRSTSEVYMYIVDANFYLLSVTGPAAARARISAAQKARWAKAKGQKVVPIKAGKRHISAAGLARIRAAARARWAKVRAAKK